MFKRKILSKLEAWKQDERHKPLILRGARQVGKTTVVNEFGRTRQTLWGGRTDANPKLSLNDT